jgi:phosphatidylglycerol:prolipoprotein diacylglycerol transferase
MQLPDAVIHHPFEFNIGPLSLTGFGLAVLAAFVIAQIISQRELTRRGHHEYAEVIPDLIFASVLGTLLGGKLYYILLITHDWRDFFTRAGFVFWGGFIGAVALNWIFVKRKKLEFVRFADVAGLAIAAGYAVGRTGCWAVGDDYGRPWNSRFAVAFPEGAPPSTAGIMNQMFGTPIPPGASPDTVLAVHPTQLYETAIMLVAFAVLWRMRTRVAGTGWLFGAYLVFAGVERFLVEFVRAKDDRLLGPFTLAQLTSVGLVLIGMVIVARLRTSPEIPPGAYLSGDQKPPKAKSLSEAQPVGRK